MTSNGACTTCGKGYKKWEFGFDALGRTILSHHCDPTDVARFQRTFTRSVASGATLKLCACGRQFMGSILSIRCASCKRAVERSRATAVLAEARKRRCADCNRCATKYSTRCRRCARAARSRKAA